MDEATGSIGSYEIVRKLEDGDPIRYLARATDGTQRVLYVITPGDPDVADELRQQLAIAATIAHPALDPIVDVAEHDGRLVVAYEDREGIGLDEVLAALEAQNRALPSAAVYHVGHQIFGALSRAHSASNEEGDFVALCHGYLTPREVMIGPQGEVRLRGLGLAPAAGTLGLEAEPGFAAPEQRSGAGRVTPRGDIYGATAVLWSLLAGAAPAEDRLDLSALRQKPPAQLAEALAMALEPSLGKRKVTSIELEQLLEPLCATTGKPALKDAITQLQSGKHSLRPAPAGPPRTEPPRGVTAPRVGVAAATATGARPRSRQATLLGAGLPKGDAVVAAAIAAAGRAVPRLGSRSTAAPASQPPVRGSTPVGASAPPVPSAPPSGSVPPADELAGDRMPGAPPRVAPRPASSTPPRPSARPGPPALNRRAAEAARPPGTPAPPDGTEPAISVEPFPAPSRRPPPLQAPREVDPPPRAEAEDETTELEPEELPLVRTMASEGTVVMDGPDAPPELEMALVTTPQPQEAAAAQPGSATFEASPTTLPIVGADMRAIATPEPSPRDTSPPALPAIPPAMPPAPPPNVAVAPMLATSPPGAPATEDGSRWTVGAVEGTAVEKKTPWLLLVLVGILTAAAVMAVGIWVTQRGADVTPPPPSGATTTTRSPSGGASSRASESVSEPPKTASTAETSASEPPTASAPETTSATDSASATDTATISASAVEPPTATSSASSEPPPPPSGPEPGTIPAGKSLLRVTSQAEAGAKVTLEGVPVGVVNETLEVSCAKQRVWVRVLRQPGSQLVHSQPISLICQQLLEIKIP